MNGSYLTLAARIRHDLDEVELVVDRVEIIWLQASRESDDVAVDAAALNLHGVYAGLERLFERIAATVDKSTPSGANRHQELLRQMAVEIPGIRPAVLSNPTRERLEKYRGFRHVVRNVYTFNLDPIQIDLPVQGLPDTFATARAELLAFADILQQAGSDT